ncbi:MAG: hypothetical protein ACOCP8_03155 [archaeon]
MSMKHGMDWGSIPEAGSGNVDFLRLTHGDNVVRVIGRPSEIKVHWEKAVDNSTKKVLCPGSGCPLCKSGKAPQVRYQVQVLDRDDESKVKVLEGGKSIFNAIKAYAVDPDYGDPTKYDVKVKKEGSGRETRYTVMASPKRSELTDDELQRIEESKSLEEINQVKSIDEIMEMGLEALVGSTGDLADDDWGADGAGGNSVSDDDWNEL